MSPGTVINGLPVPLLPPPPFSPVFWELGKLIQLLGVEQCGCAVKSGYFWILPPLCPTQATQLSGKDVSLETRPSTE